jgi:integrase
MWTAPALIKTRSEPVPTNKLTHLTANNLVKVGRKARTGDGGGLWLDVRGEGRAAWVFRYTRQGKAREVGLGSQASVSLVQAREAAADCRALLAKGTDPLAQREAELVASQAATKAQQAADAAGKITFRVAAESRMSAMEAQYRNAKHRQQWASTLTTYAYPELGNIPVDAVTRDDVVRALEPIWLTKPETARRLRQRIEVVLDYAASRDWRTGANPAVWRGGLSHLLPATKKASGVRHHPALPWQQLPSMMSALTAAPGMGSLALRFAILTAARSEEVRGARWSEIDLVAKAWTVPASRMKRGRVHRVPLSAEALNVLTLARQFRQSADSSALVFPGSKPGKKLSDMTLGAVIKRLNKGEQPIWVDADGARVVPHGFRSTFRDWCSDCRSEPREVAEKALSHAVGNAVEAAYRRGDLFDRRVKLMEAWGSYCVGRSGAKVTPIRRLAG